MLTVIVSGLAIGRVYAAVNAANTFTDGSFKLAPR